VPLDGPLSALPHGECDLSESLEFVDDRQRLRTTFDQAADLYQQARPEYPEELLDRLIEGCGLQPGDQVLEVGAGPGKATLPLARRGLQITALEPGAALAAEARRNLADYPVDVVQARFEDWDGPAGRYGAVVSATAWHWVDPHLRYQLAARALRPEGHLAFWSAQHVFPLNGDPFFDEIQQVYDAIGQGLPGDAPRPAPGELPVQTEEIEASGHFDVVDVEHFDWTLDYDAEAYLDLLRTFSGHIAMPAESRETLFTEIRRRLATRPSGKVRRGWGAVLHIAKKSTCTAGSPYSNARRGS
jgi:SAM-dependent methyltransferase